MRERSDRLAGWALKRKETEVKHMITCPNCGEMVGNNVDTCFNCSYDFKLRRVPAGERRMR